MEDSDAGGLSCGSGNGTGGDSHQSSVSQGGTSGHAHSHSYQPHSMGESVAQRALRGISRSPLTCLGFQAPARVPSRSSRVWFGTHLPERQWSASPRPTATAAAATPPCGPPPRAWSPAGAPPPASCRCARSPPRCSCGWAPPPTRPAPPPPSPATASLRVNATRWWASWATTACAAPRPIPSASTILLTTIRSSTTPRTPPCAETTFPTECRFAGRLACAEQRVC